MLFASLARPGAGARGDQAGRPARPGPERAIFYRCPARGDLAGALARAAAIPHNAATHFPAWRLTRRPCPR